ncbi:pre-peptidase C-terminal domain-containing protein, partial [Scytonema sp. NUACC26]|uniref:pre-peptidase C-terminal domain-containing protein n=1 Tax=Scytonema sp. NUACC26 TaxID=3140176 RepID=UPI0038B3760F
VQLLNSSGNVLTSSTSSGTASESISYSLDTGTYYIRVYPYNGANTSYNLSVFATINDFAGNTLNNARQINLNSVASAYSDWVGSTDTDDYYRLSLGMKSSVNLTLNSLAADADVQLIRDANSNGIVDSGEVIASSTNGGTTAESIRRTLDAGTYYIRVYPFNGANTNYNLNVSATPDDYALNTLSNAHQITLNSTTSTYTDWVGSADTNDYYRLNLDATKSLNLALNGLSGNADVQLLDSNGNAIATSTNSGTAAESISRTLNAGTYYIRVYPGNSGASTFYNLSIESTTVPVESHTLNSKWIRQLGTAGDDSSYSVAVDGAGNVYITGITRGALGGSNAGKVDAWIAKY